MCLPRNLLRGGRARGGLLLLVFLVGAGCASLPTPPEIPQEAGLEDGLKDRLGDELGPFLFRSLAVGAPFLDELRPQFFFAVDLREEPSIMDELLQLGVVEQIVADRAHLLLGAFEEGKAPRFWVEGNFPRFRTPWGLFFSGWRRLGPGHWRDVQGTEVIRYRQGLLEISYPALESPKADLEADLKADLKDLSKEPLLEDHLRHIHQRPTGFFVMVSPSLFETSAQGSGTSRLDALNPETLVLQLRGGGDAEMELLFSGERQARVVLVSLRLGSRQVLPLLHLEAGPDFAIERQEKSVYLRNVLLTDESVRLLVQRIIQPQEEDR
ncbi:hypothetical protein [Alkalispirochaeta americana]|uniref:hypothetical protein n=1 Tax=Alkalispirochaeta americana TaxID=159291 RepID=UPI00097034EB|nr:hypothetical protein [Alkalispirochaeta americana]